MTTAKEDKKAAVAHILIPKHIKLGDKEKKELMEKYAITVRQLPKILASDPALAGIDVKAGDIVKIVRKSPTAGETVFYRGVLNA